MTILYFLRRTAEYLVASADTRPNLVILRFRVARSVKVGLENKFSLLIVSKRLQNGAHQGGKQRTAKPYSIAEMNYDFRFRTTRRR